MSTKRHQVGAPSIPAHDFDIERAILGAPLQEPDTLDAVLARTLPEHFFHEPHRLIRRRMGAMHASGRAMDIVSLTAALREAGEFDEPGVRECLPLLFSEGAIPAHVGGYIEELHEFWAKRRVSQLALRIDQQAQNGARVRELLRTAHEELREIAAPLAPATSSPLAVGAGEFLACELPTSEPLVEGILSSDGSGWIAGEEKLGKTMYALHEALCLSFALPVLRRFEVPTRRRVLFIEEEDPPRRTQTRLRAQVRGLGYDPDDSAVRGELDRWFRLAVWTGFSLDEPAIVARLVAELEASEPHVVYLDVLRKLTLRDLNKAAEAAAVFNVLDDLRRRYGTVFRVLHHYRKSQGFRTGRGSQEIGGSFVLGAWAESSVFLEPIGRKQGAVRVEIQTKDGAPVPGFRLRIESEGPRHAPTVIRLVAEDDGDSSDEVDELVHQAVASLPTTEPLAGKPGVPLSAIVAAVKRSDRTVRRAIKRLEDAGRIVVTGQLAKHKLLYGVNV